MGTLSSFSFSLISPNGGNFRDKFQNNRTNCLLCGEILLKRRRRLVVGGGDFGRLNSVIRYCYNGENDSGDDSSSSSSSSGEREGKENSNLATMTPAEKKSEDNADDPPPSASSRVSEFFENICVNALCFSSEVAAR